MRPILEFLEAVSKGSGLVAAVLVGVLIFAAIGVYRAWNNRGRGGPPPNE